MLIQQMRMQALSRTEELFAFDHLIESLIEGCNSAEEIKASGKASTLKPFSDHAACILLRLSFNRHTLRPDLLGVRHSSTKRDRARKNSNLLQPSRLEPRAHLGISVLPLIARRVPVESVKHAPFRIGIHCNFCDEPQREKKRDAVEVVQGNRRVAQPVEPARREPGGEGALDAA